MSNPTICAQCGNAATTMSGGLCGACYYASLPPEDTGRHPPIPDEFKTTSPEKGWDWLKELHDSDTDNGSNDDSDSPGGGAVSEAASTYVPEEPLADPERRERERFQPSEVAERNWFERLIVKRFVLTATLVVFAFAIIVVITLLVKLITLDQLATLVDTLLKALVILLGALWSLNRYFITRTDYPQLRVEASTDIVPSTAFGSDATFGLLSYRLDIINTGKILLPATGYRVNVDSVSLRKNRVFYRRLYEWPRNNLHPAYPIEPGSWAGISDAIVCSREVRAVRVFLEVHLEKREPWTWHRIITIPSNPSSV